MAEVDQLDTVERARRGDSSAFGAIYEEHAGTAWRLALAVEPAHAAAADAVAEAFGKVLSPAEKGTPARRTAPARVQLLGATREAAVAGPAHPTGAPAPALDVTGTRARAEGNRALDAFDELPERWRSVLWLSEVERLNATEVSAVLGLSPQATIELHERALAGLREQFVSGLTDGASTPDCRRTAERLGGYAAGTLPPRDSTRVRRHLDRCATCRGRLDAVDDLRPRLLRTVPPVPPMLRTLAELVWTERRTAGRGPLGLTLPSGRPVPAWTERALASATAAVVTIGISAAILAGGRSSRDEPERLAGRGQVLGADGESALADPRPPATDGPRDEPSTGDDAADPPASTGTSTTPAATNPSTAGPTTDQPRGSTGPAPTTPSGPTAPTGPTDPTGPGTPTPPPPPPPPGSDPLVNLRVDDDTGVTVGECTGVEVIGIVIGCEPDEGTSVPVIDDLLGL